jgi:hypothetical protein
LVSRRAIRPNHEANRVTAVSVLKHDPRGRTRHRLHGDGCVWSEKNCYVDAWIEILHALGLEPLALMAFTVALDFEGDQWTFFKPPHRDLAELYGVGVQELYVWRPLLRHVEHHLGEGKLVLTEADAYLLPDTLGTTYRQEHTKTTVAIERIDTGAEQVGYFHNRNYGVLEGDDYRGLFRIGAPDDPSYMPLFAEIVRVDNVRRRTPAELVGRSIGLLREHAARRPASNPFDRFARCFARDVAAIGAASPALYHAYAFATLRQCGANFELAGAYLRWVDEALGSAGPGSACLVSAAAEFETISSTAKALLMKGARVALAGGTADFAPMLDLMARSWTAGMSQLDQWLAAPGSPQG